MLTPVAVARACIESNERLLLATRHRLAVSRRCLYYPGLKIAGASGEADAQSSVRAIVRTLLASGALWPIRGKVTWAGYGSGQACCVCGKPVNGSQVEYEVDDGSRKLPGCHFACFVAWHEESETFNGDGQLR
jgi:hypothetical protein